MYLGNNSKDFTAINMKKKTAFNGYVFGFSNDYRAFDTSNIVDVYKYFHKYLMKKHDIK